MPTALNVLWFSLDSVSDIFSGNRKRRNLVGASHFYRKNGFKTYFFLYTLFTLWTAISLLILLIDVIQLSLRKIFSTSVIWFSCTLFFFLFLVGSRRPSSSRPTRGVLSRASTNRASKPLSTSPSSVRPTWYQYPTWKSSARTHGEWGLCTWSSSGQVFPE